MENNLENICLKELEGLCQEEFETIVSNLEDLEWLKNNEFKMSLLTPEQLEIINQIN
jgi:hypothetical protein